MNTKLLTSEKPSPQLDDPDEVPPLDRDFFERGAIYHGEKLIRPGRPRKAEPKQLTSLRLDPAVLRAFRAMGRGWQTRMNDVLRDYLRLHKGAARARQPPQIGTQTAAASTDGPVTTKPPH